MREHEEVDPLHAERVEARREALRFRSGVDDGDRSALRTTAASPWPMSHIATCQSAGRSKVPTIRHETRTPPYPAATRAAVRAPISRARPRARPSTATPIATAMSA